MASMEQKLLQWHARNHKYMPQPQICSSYKSLALGSAVACTSCQHCAGSSQVQCNSSEHEVLNGTRLAPPMGMPQTTVVQCSAQQPKTALRPHLACLCYKVPADHIFWPLFVSNTSIIVQSRAARLSRQESGCANLVPSLPYHNMPTMLPWPGVPRVVPMHIRTMKWPRVRSPCMPGSRCIRAVDHIKNGASQKRAGYTCGE